MTTSIDEIKDLEDQFDEAYSEFMNVIGEIMNRCKTRLSSGVYNTLSGHSITTYAVAKQLFIVLQVEGVKDELEDIVINSPGIEA